MEETFNICRRVVTTITSTKQMVPYDRGNGHLVEDISLRQGCVAAGAGQVYIYGNSQRWVQKFPKLNLAKIKMGVMWASL